MSERTNTPTKFAPSADGPEGTLDNIRAVVETILGPESAPNTPPGLLREDQLDEHRTLGSEDYTATMRYHLWAGDVMGRNRRALGSLLWACDELRQFRGEPEFSELGAPLTLALSRFGVSDVPTTGLGRRQIVEAWTSRREQLARGVAA